MKTIASTLAILLLAFSTAFATPFPKDTRVVGVVFDKGADTVKIPDETKRDAPVMYRVRAKKGQTLTIILSPENQNADFVLYAPGKWPGVVRHDSGAAGNRHYSGQIDSDGVYAIVVSPSPEGRDQGEPAKYELTITLRSASK